MPDMGPDVKVAATTPGDPWVRQFITDQWGSDVIVAHGRTFHPDELPGFVARVDGTPAGLLTYHVAEDACEIVTLDSVIENRGVGSALVDAVRGEARARGCRRVRLVTTNDNLHALRFYQRRGFYLIALRPGAVDAARRVKPEIPHLGNDGIPIRDEVELEMPIFDPPHQSDAGVNGVTSPTVQMQEGRVIERTPSPRTRQSLAADLHDLGLQSGDLVLVHSSLSSLGWVNGGPVAVVQALMDVVTPNGTVVVPTQTGDLSDPARWAHPPIPPDWWQTVRDTMPVYDPDTSPTRAMGRIVEAFRTWPGVVRSGHPHASFAAWGKHAAEIVDNHLPEYGLGEQSPLARIYDLDGLVLLLGVGYGNNTSFHLAEYRVPHPPRTEQAAPIIRDGRRVWHRWPDVDIDDEPFERLGTDFERESTVRIGHVGSADARLFRQRDAVDFAARWLTERQA